MAAAVPIVLGAASDIPLGAVAGVLFSLQLLLFYISRVSKFCTDISTDTVLVDSKAFNCMLMYN